MDPRALIIGQRWGSKDVEIISGPEVPIGEQEAKFMPFRLNRSNADFEWAALCRLDVERLERFSKAETPAQPTKGKSPMKSVKDTLKSALALIAFAAIALTQSVQAQSYNISYIGGATANSPASTDNTTWYTTNSTPIAITKASNVALQVESKLQGAGTSAVIFRFGASADGVTYTSNYLLVTNTAAGTTLVSSVRDVAVGGIGFLRLESINNANATAVTNLFVRYAFKSP